MAVLAISAAGYDCSHETLSIAKSYIISEKNQWTALGRELDGALAIQAYLEICGEWEDIAFEAQRLSQWARGESLWRGATMTSNESLNQSCRVAQIASHLIGIVWTTLQNELSSFLDAFATPDHFKTDFNNEYKEKVIEYAELHDFEYSDLPLNLLKKISNLSLNKYVVVGNYYRYDERLRRKLSDWCNNLIYLLRDQSKVHKNFLIWATPKSGKSFLINEIANKYRDEISFFDLNIAQLSKDNFIESIGKIYHSQKPTLCLIDEIDVRVDEKWPYEKCFTILDSNLNSTNQLIFVLVGSSSTGIQGLSKNIEKRKNGKELIDKIPNENRFEIFDLSYEDIIILVLSSIKLASEQRGIVINEVEKLALYYILKNSEIYTPRQLSDLIVSAVNKLAVNETKLTYDDLFHAGDRRNQQFWADNQTAAAELSSIFLLIND